MTDVKSKNLYELLGNTESGDEDQEAPAPTKVAEPPVARAGKRDAPKPAPTEPTEGFRGGRGGRGGRRGDFTGNERGTFSQAFTLLSSSDHTCLLLTAVFADTIDPASFPRPQHWQRIQSWQTDRRWPP